MCQGKKRGWGGFVDKIKGSEYKSDILCLQEFQDAGNITNIYK